MNLLQFPTHKTTRKITPRRSAFTLIEILVVLAIIGVLAAILFPVFSSARESARIATCSSNLKQAYLGIQMYMRDSNNRYPRPTSKCGWASLVYPYVKSTAVFECPNDEYFQFDTSCREGSTTNQTGYNGSYNINQLQAGNRTSISESYVNRPSEVILLMDGDGRDIPIHGGGKCSGPNGVYDNLYDCTVHDIMASAQGSRGHNGGFNFGFADGHVKWIGADSMDKRSMWYNSRDAYFSGSPTPTPVTPPFNP